MKKYRVIATHHKWYSNGEWNEERIQTLQKKKTINFILFKFSFWVNVDSEVVPSHVWLSHAIFGDHNYRWKSKFKEHIL